MKQLDAPRDTQIDLITPENIAFHYRVAGPFRRLPAALIDWLIIAAIVVITSVILGIAFGFFSPLTAYGIELLVWFVLSWFYKVLFETYWNGQTPGKRALQLRVISVDGQPVAAYQVLLRNLLIVVDGLPWLSVEPYLPLYALGLAATAMNDRMQRLGDLAAGTMVVVEEPQRLYGVSRVNEPEVLELARQLPRDLVVSRSLASTLSDYVLRRKSFPWSRRAEIAQHLGSLLVEKYGLPRDTSHDLLLCALYHRVFLSEEDDEPLEAVIVRPSQVTVDPWEMAR